MKYELYVDDIIFINAVMNMYILLITDSYSMKTASKTRLFMGALISSFTALLPLFMSGKIWVKVFSGILSSCVLMPIISFEIHNISTYLAVSEKLVYFTVLMGGVQLFCRQFLGVIGIDDIKIWGMLGVGALFTLFLTKTKRENTIARAVIRFDEKQITLSALIDTGNSLVEPISGFPVALIGKKTADKLFAGKEDVLYRAIPFCGVGKNHGILKGYRIPEVNIEYKGFTKCCKNAYVAVCEEYFDGRDIGIIINPRMIDL